MPSFSARRRDALGYSGPCSGLCRPSSTAFLVLVAGVWLTVLVLFATSAFTTAVDTEGSHRPSSFLGMSRGGKGEGKTTPLTEEQLLQREVEDLDERLRELERRRDAVPRPALELKHQDQAEVEAKKEAEEAARKLRRAQEKAKEEEEEEEKKKKREAAANAKGAAAAATKKAAPAPVVVPNQEKTEEEKAKYAGAPKPKQDAKAKEGQYDSDTSPVPLVDPTALARNPPSFQHDDMEELCAHPNDGDAEILKRVDVWPDAEMGKPRILCFSYTLSKAHDTAVNNLRMTWAQRCDGYLAMSDLTEPSIPSIDIKHKGPEAYENMWQKIRSIWLYLHKHHLHDFDYFVSGGDDLFLVVENLRKYLLSEEIQTATAHGAKPIFLGRPFRPPGNDIAFNSGGAGFVLNTAAVDVLGKELLGEGKSKEKCRPNQVGFWEDVNVAYCLNEGGVKIYNGTQDEMGRERFLPFTPGNHFGYRIPPRVPDWYALYTKEWGLKFGLDCCSREAITFHYVKEGLMKRYHAIVHGLCPNIKRIEEGREGGVETERR